MPEGLEAPGHPVIRSVSGVAAAGAIGLAIFTAFNPSAAVHAYDTITGQTGHSVTAPRVPGPPGMTTAPVPSQTHWVTQQPPGTNISPSGPDQTYQTPGQPSFKFLVTGGTTQGIGGDGAVAVTEWAPGPTPGTWAIVYQNVFATPGNTTPVNVVRITSDGIVITDQGGHLGQLDLNKYVPSY